MAWYFTRQKAHTAATKAFGPVDVAVDGSTAGAIRMPQGATAITKVTATYVVDGGHITITGTVPVLRITGPGLVQGTQDLVLAAEHMEDGGGALTWTGAKNITPTAIPVFIPVKPGNDISLQLAYYGTDSGNQYVGVTLEVS